MSLQELAIGELGPVLPLFHQDIKQGNKTSDAAPSLSKASCSSFATMRTDESTQADVSECGDL